MNNEWCQDQKCLDHLQTTHHKKGSCQSLLESPRSNRYSWEEQCKDITHMIHNFIYAIKIQLIRDGFLFISHICGILKGSSGSGRVTRQNDTIKWYTQERFGSNIDNVGTKMIKGSLFVSISSVITSRPE